MYFNINVLEHLRHFTLAAQRRGAVGYFKLGSMDAAVRVGNQEVEFRAQYVIQQPDGSLNYSMKFGDDATGFVGWLPYFNKRWPEALDKLVFKQRVADARLPTPLWSIDGVSSELGDFVVKGRKGSFGQRMRGPFKAAMAESITLAPDEFAERFFLGQIGKAWYWNDRVVALELREPPTVTGDGVATIGALVSRANRRANVTDETDFSRYRGFRWSDVPARDQDVIVDFRYGSLAYRFQFQSLNRYPELKDSAVAAKLDEWGTLFWHVIPDAQRNGVLYSVDFLVPDDGRIRLLEMNCNPIVPPEAYESIFTTIFGDPLQDVPVAVGDALQPAEPLFVPAPPSPLAVPPATAILERRVSDGTVVPRP
jgi:hypothetical protein